MFPKSETTEVFVPEADIKMQRTFPDFPYDIYNMVMNVLDDKLIVCWKNCIYLSPPCDNGSWKNFSSLSGWRYWSSSFIGKDDNGESAIVILGGYDPFLSGAETSVEIVQYERNIQLAYELPTPLRFDQKAIL